MNSLAFAVRRHVMAESNLRLLQSSIRKNNPKAPISILTSQDRCLFLSKSIEKCFFLLGLQNVLLWTRFFP